MTLDRRRFLRSSARGVWAFSALRALGGGFAYATPNWVNLVIIMADDLATWGVGYNNPEIRTPNLNALAARGMSFRNAFAASPVCSPSRATFLTGRIPSQHGIHSALTRIEDFGLYAKPLLDDEITLSDILSQYGYDVGICGKWHLGTTLKPQKGFCCWAIIPYGVSTYNDASMIRDERLEITHGYLTDVITDRALEFMEAHQERPFCLLATYTAPHSPYTGHPERYVTMYRKSPFNSVPREGVHPWATAAARNIGNREVLANYFAAVTAMDESIGRIMEFLGKSGLDKRTLVVFLSDQGYMVGHHGLWGKGEASEPKNLFDESLRIPLIFYHSGHIRARKESDIMVGGYDLFPTLLDYLGLSFPGMRGGPPLKVYEGCNLPGRSFAASIKEQELDWKDEVYAEYGLVRMVRTERWKLVRRYPSGPDELYDLHQDPIERTNLIGAKEIGETERELMEMLESWFLRYAEPGKDPVRLQRDPTRKFELFKAPHYPGYPRRE